MMDRIVDGYLKAEKVVRVHAEADGYASEEEGEEAREARESRSHWRKQAEQLIEEGRKLGHHLEMPHIIAFY